MEMRQQWHVSPLIDTLFYHFGWLIILVPLLFCGNNALEDWGYLRVYALILALNFIHRHYGFPYAYLDRRVFQFHRARLIRFPALCIALMIALPIAARFPGSAVFESALATLIFIDATWNLWHAHMQKYGILRIYNQKALLAPGTGVPGWIDKLFVFAWIPLYFAYLGPMSRSLLEEEQARPIRAFVIPLTDALNQARGFLLPASAAFAALAVGLFMHSEWKTHKLRCRPRLSMALGLIMLSSAMLLLNPMKVFLAFAFNHAIEYMVYVWAAQRARYGTPPDGETLLGALLRRPALYYACLTLGLGAAYLYLSPFWDTILAGKQHFNKFHFGLQLSQWLLLWGLGTSFIHYHTDGFLWKLRNAPLKSTAR